ncbi:SGNH/GDSL hydrolase family protein [Sphingobacterium daejeonense]|uniref:SGNH/GDSL hydrolase family protein n=1 Tax=Sphingobacterium daejeonense TaxID=371142 RepID=UPI0010C2DCCF|nr:SGNH/GDSL hydrolase family protein [Sphingobacterium daejeonense]VTP94914.1 Uncharacterised protein [Sphingobacterium daejeonense]
MKQLLKKYRILILIISALLFVGVSTYIYYYKFYIPTIFENAQSGRYKGKKGVTFGDSITWYDGKSFFKTHKEYPYKAVGYQEYVRQYFDCQIDNKGISSLDMTQILNEVIRYKYYNNVSFVTLTSGANDARKGINLGKIKDIGGDFDRSTFIGAMQIAIEHILNQNKSVDLYLITPINGFFKETGTKDVPGPYKNLNYISEDYSKAIIDLGHKYNLKVCDWYNNIEVQNDKDYLFGDKINIPYQLHPTNLLYNKMGMYLCNIMGDM